MQPQQCCKVVQSLPLMFTKTDLVKTAPNLPGHECGFHTVTKLPESHTAYLSKYTKKGVVLNPRETFKDTEL